MNRRSDAAVLLLAWCAAAACGRHDVGGQSQGAFSLPSDATETNTASTVGTRSRMLGSDAARSAVDAPPPVNGDPDATRLTARATPTGATIPMAEDTVLRVFLGGDVSFGRDIGQRVLAESEFQPLAALTPWLEASDVRLVNLESILSDQGGITVHPQNPLVFSGPPAAAMLLSRAHIDAVSVANNHSWDYGRKGLGESLLRLSEAGIATAGASMDRRPYRAATLRVRDLEIAFLAFTLVWNDGSLEEHVAQHFVAGSDYDAMKRALRNARRDHDFVIVSMHASNEYVPLPRERTRKFAKALIGSGADLVFGHHPHVLQGFEWISNRPILYSLGNLIFQSEQTRPETERSAVALLDFRRTEVGFELNTLRACPVILEDGVPRPFMWQDFEPTMVGLSKTLGGVKTALEAATGCVLVEQSETPLAYSARRGFAPDPADRRALDK